MELAGPFLQLWLTLGLGVDTAGYAPAQLVAGADLVTPGLPLRAGFFGTFAVDDDDRSRIGAGGVIRWYGHHAWLYAGAALELGDQERDGTDLLFVAVDAIAGARVTSDGRLAVELAAGVQGESEIAIRIFGNDEPPERRSSAHATARMVVRL